MKVAKGLNMGGCQGQREEGETKKGGRLREGTKGSERRKGRGRWSSDLKRDRRKRAENEEKVRKRQDAAGGVDEGKVVGGQRLGMQDVGRKWHADDREGGGATQRTNAVNISEVQRRLLRAAHERGDKRKAMA